MGKNIVVCNDGTGNKYGKNNTNVVKAFERIRRDTPGEPTREAGRQYRQQIAFYDPGIGTFSILGNTPGPIRQRLGRLIGQAFGYGLRQNLSDALRFLIRYYEPGDCLYFIGFSRGAFTVRVLADLVAMFGVLRPGCENLIPYVLEMYFKRKNYPETILTGFTESFCNLADIKCVAVFDTVASLGWALGKTIRPRRLDGGINPSIKSALHAMAIDEKRKKFPVARWDVDNDETGESDQVVKQVWFAGVHSDVGGWYEERGLSDIALKWLLAEAQVRGLVLERGWDMDLSDDPLGKMHNSRTGFWRLWPPAPRQIKAGDWVHGSVYIRKEHDDLNYYPSLKDSIKIETPGQSTATKPDS